MVIKQCFCSVLQHSAIPKDFFWFDLFFIIDENSSSCLFLVAEKTQKSDFILIFCVNFILRLFIKESDACLFVFSTLTEFKTTIKLIIQS